jgi:hypothetical protein
LCIANLDHLNPIRFRGGINWYGYVDNNPTNYFDPYGLNPFKLPANPGSGGSNLPTGWRQIPEHIDPNNPGLERWVSPNGDEGLEFHPGKNGENGWEGKDHWHKLNPKPGRKDRWEKDDTVGDDGHFNPDEEVDLNSCPRANDGWRLPNWAYPSPVSPVPYPVGVNPYAPAAAGAVILVVVVVVVVVII